MLTFVRLLAVAVSVVITPPSAQAISFAGLGLPVGVFEGRPAAVSADGTTVVGWNRRFFQGVEGIQGFRWTSAGMVPLEPFGSFASAVSADGSVVVGTHPTGRAVRWVGGTFEYVIVAPSAAGGVSADGSVVVGSCENRATVFGGVRGCNYLDVQDTYAAAVSADGSVVVGRGFGNTDFLWTGGNRVELGYLPDGGSLTRANDVSADGSVVVGQAVSDSGTEAFRWTSAGIVGLGDLPGGVYWSHAASVSADGSVVVGWGSAASTAEAFLWDEANGMRELDRVLVGLGLDIEGWELSFATSISDDGRTIVGYGWNPDGLREGWLAQIPEVSTLALLGPSLAALVIARRRLG